VEELDRDPDVLLRVTSMALLLTILALHAAARPSVELMRTRTIGAAALGLWLRKVPNWLEVRPWFVRQRELGLVLCLFTLTSTLSSFVFDGYRA
jgi:hypothetical protein